MNSSDRLSVSTYKTVTPINEQHGVYLVRHQETGRLFVKKILSVYSADIYRKLRQHPVAGIPGIITFCEENGKLIVIEDFISGTPLSDKIGLIRSSPPSALTVSEIGRYMIGVCEILEQLHSLDPPVIHRDIKPSNIMITVSGSVVLLDLNAARFYSGNPTRKSDTRLLGTHGYAAPEQYGFRESSPQTDLFSVGMTLKEAMDALPYRDHTFDAVIARCTRMDPSKRYSSAGALKSAIRRNLLWHELAGTTIWADIAVLFLLTVLIAGIFFVLI